MRINKRIIIAAGGTGGHLYPGIALARSLKERGAEPCFIIRKNDIGKIFIEKEGFKYFEIDVIGLRRKISFKLVLFLIKIISGYFSSAKIIKNYNPDIVIGMGGYISFPVLLSSKIKGYKTAVCEQNSIAGLSNRIAGIFADRVFVSFEDTKRYFKNLKTVLTGNPVRKEVFNSKPKEAYSRFSFKDNRFTVLFFGGSQGASKINDIALDTLKYLENYKDRVQFLHLTGKNDYKSIKEEYDKRGFLARVFEYLEEIGDAYAISGIIICRAGATTIAELMYVNKYAVLIPFPFAAKDHQYKNALAYSRIKDCLVVRQQEVDTKVLSEKIVNGIENFKTPENAITCPKVLPQDEISKIILEIIT